MKPRALTLLCVGLLACSHDKQRPETAHEQQQAREPGAQAQMLRSESDEPLTPASGVGEPRATSGPALTDPQMAPNDSGIDQGVTAADMVVTRDVREALLSDPSLSFTAKSITIVTRDGRVTLRGMVNTKQERAAVERTARRTAGVLQVDNELGTMAD
jgi:hypothetical protein